MNQRHRFATAARRAVPVVALAVVLAGCASANKTASTPASGSSSSSTSSTMTGMNMGATTTPSVSGSSTSFHGLKPVPTQVLATTTWQGMKIQAMATTPVPFVVYNGTTEQLIKPGHASFHLMVMLTDSQTGVAIPYSTVWATISKGTKVVYDERQWPMISRYMGPHYGNDVKVPGAGTYKLSLLVSPPVSARHVEYQHVWLAPHRANFTFHWSGV
jgi:predicted metal-binding membrane protein